MSEIHEVVLVDVQAPTLLDLRATALRPTGDRAWHIFISPGDSDRWLGLIDCKQLQPLHFDPQAAHLYAKLAHLLGVTWDECWDAPRDVLREQRQLLERVDGPLRRRLDLASVAEVAGMREDFEPVAVSEVRGLAILRDVVGVAAEAANN